MTSTAPVPTHSDAHHDGGGQLLAGLSGLDVLPLWTRMEKLNPPSPAPKAIAHKWRLVVTMRSCHVREALLTRIENGM